MSDKELILMVGLPRSGKSTVAREMGYPVVSPDAIRLAVHGKTFLKEAEYLIWPMAVMMVKALFHAGHDVVILDATNHTKERRKFWRDAGPWALTYRVVDTKLNVCLLRAVTEEDLEDPPNEFSLVPVIERMNDAWEDPADDGFGLVLP